MGRKGGGYEREVCRLLSLWWTSQGHDDVFWRTSQSGGRATTRAKRGKKTRAHCGDICALDHVGRPLTGLITFEMKRGYNANTFCEVIDQPSRRKRTKPGVFEGFICQALSAAERAGTPFWAIIHRRDNRDAVICYPVTLMDELSDRGCQLDIPAAYCSFRTMSGVRVKFVVMRLDRFLAGVPPRAVLDVWRVLCRPKKARARRSI